MKSTSDIAKELRAKGYRFSQQALITDLAEYIPAVTLGRITAYNDEVVGFMEAKYAELRPVRFAPVGEPTPVVVDNSMDDIKRMLIALCARFDVTV